MERSTKDKFEQAVQFWFAGAIAILLVMLTTVGAQVLFINLAQGYALVFMLFGLITIPLLIGMFIAPRFRW